MAHVCNFSSQEAEREEELYKSEAGPGYRVSPKGNKSNRNVKMLQFILCGIHSAMTASLLDTDRGSHQGRCFVWSVVFKRLTMKDKEIIL